MAKKRKAYLHVGLDDGSGDFVGAALGRHRRALAELGVSSPAESGEEMFRAALEMTRTHQDWGFGRSEVEGAWTDVWRRAEKEKGRNAVVVSQTLLATARPEQVELALDAVAGFQTHVVVTAQAPDAWTVPGDLGHDLASVLERWGASIKPERLHVVIGSDRDQVWKRLGKIVGFGTSSLPVDALATALRARPPHLASAERARTLRVLGQGWADLLAQGDHDVVGDPEELVPGADRVGSAVTTATVTEQALGDALYEVERLTRRNESLELRIEALEKKRRKLKKRLRSVA